LTGPAYSERKGTKIIGFVPHVQVGHNSLRAYFSDTQNQASSHLWVSYKGVLEQYVPFDKAAWTQAAGNKAWVTCECEGFPNEPYTDEQLNVLAEFFAWGAKEFGWALRITDSPNMGGLGTHVMGGSAWGGHSCPGTIRAGQRLEILRRTQSIGIPAVEHTEKVPDMSLTDDDKKWLSSLLFSDAFRLPIVHAGWQYPAPNQDVMTPETVHEVLRFVMDRLTDIEAQLKKLLNPDNK
jgi:hypothetical protein